MSLVTSKAFILGEIRRTAADNGGKPLGAARFQSVTGIGRPDWLGVYWARWGDALIEAGFAPNEFQGAYNKDELIQFYAELAKELGHLPVQDEVKIKRRADSSFPSWEPYKRFGGKLELIRAVAHYCGSRLGYDEVAKWCEHYLAADNKSSVADSEQGSDTDDSVTLGYVYLAKSGWHYKIGKSNAAGRREYEISLQLPEKLKMVHVITTDDPTGIEAYWHKRFEASRKNGEWFDLNSKDVAAFKMRRKFM